ncbi:hypothetical protein [Streptomyces harbinensis]|uniref:hypothetical protein n=1 Tax=Streptomyces harbinensis TaxID=1176198 RepID=UPI0036BB242F
MLEPFAAPDDLAARMPDRDLTDRERAAAAVLLADASALMRQAVPGLDDPEPPDTAVGVCCAMVLRVLRNPGGLRSLSIDDYAHTVDSSRSGGDLHLTDPERESLLPGGSGAWSIAPGIVPGLDRAVAP